MAEPTHMDFQAVEKARLQIQQLVQRIAHLSQQDLTERAYYEQMLPLVVEAIAAVGGAVWRRVEANRIELLTQVNFSATQLDKEGEHQAHHGQLVAAAAQSSDGLLVLPYAGAGDGRPGANPTEFLLVLSPVAGSEHAEAVIEVFQRPTSSLETRLGYLKFLTQMSELAAQWHRRRELRRLQQRDALWSRLDAFAKTVHGSLDLNETSYAIANEMQRYLSCDRVTLVLPRGKRFRVAAISGQDEIEPRSDLVQALQQLARSVVAVREPLWYPEDLERGLPPQLETALHDYLDAAHVRTLAVLPLLVPRSPTDSESEATDAKKSPRPLGALVVEQIENESDRETLEPQVELLLPHCQRAIANARDHEGAFLFPLLRRVGKLRGLATARNLPKTLIVAALLLAAVLALIFIPAPFHLEGRGVLQPIARRDVFAEVEGLVTEVLVEHGQTVHQGTLLLRLENPDLEAEHAAKLGERQATQQRIFAIHRQRHDQKLDQAEKNRLAGELLELEQQLASLETQCELLDRKRERLQIRSPIAGQVVTWNLEQLLLQRPVTVGQVLLTVADPTSDWEIDVALPESRLGHVTAAQAKADAALPVEYVIATEPTRRCRGSLREIHAQAELHEEHGHTVSLFVDVDESELLEPRPGATIIAHVDCGTRALGYVWLHEVFEFVDSRILFNLW